MKKAALYSGSRPPTRPPDNQLHDLRQIAAPRGLEIVEVYIDHGISGASRARVSRQETTNSEVNPGTA